MKYGREIRAHIRLINAETFADYVGEIEIRNLRMAFSVLKSTSWATNKGQVQIWNLNNDKRSRLVNIGDLVSIYAGYTEEGGAQLLYTGNTIEVAHSFPQPEIISSLVCGDGDKSLNNILISRSYQSGTPARTIILDIVSLMQMPLGSDVPDTGFIYNLGISLLGLAKDALDLVCMASGIWWGVQNGNLVFQRQNEPNQKPPIFINASTGMIGIPERYTDKKNELYYEKPRRGWKVRTLLRPEILPGDRINLKSEKLNLNGMFYVETIQHDGDNYSDIFQSTLQVLEI